MAQATSKTPGRVEASNIAAVTPLASNGDILEVLTDDIDQLGFSLLPATNALDAFLMQGRMGPSDAYQTVKSATWGTVGGLLIATSGDLAALAAATAGFAVVDVRAFYSVKFLASAGTGAGTVDMYAFGKGHAVR